MKFFYSTTYLDNLDLISIGIVTENGQTLYAINASIDQQAIQDTPWLRKNVWPFLPKVETNSLEELNLLHKDVYPKIIIADDVFHFLAQTDQPEFWSNYGAYDHVVLSKLLGKISPQRLNTFPEYTNSIMQLRLHTRRRLVVPEPMETHALALARNVKEKYDFLIQEDFYV